MGSSLSVFAPDGIGEIVPGANLAAVIADACAAEGYPLADGDLVCVTSKAVSKAEGRFATGTREQAIEDETVRVVARRGPTRIVRTRLGVTMAAAGVDASNVSPGAVLLLPVDPDASARRIRDALAARLGIAVGVLVTDTAGRPWRVGQTDLCLGAGGVRVFDDPGTHDDYGNPLLVTRPCVADEIAGAAELASTKRGGRPVVVLRGRPDLVLPVLPGSSGWTGSTGSTGSIGDQGAAALVRPEADDMFALGYREAVLAALRGEPTCGPAASAADLQEALESVLGPVRLSPGPVGTDRTDRALTVHCDEPVAPAVLAAVGWAYGWVAEVVAGPAPVRSLTLRPSADLS